MKSTSHSCRPSAVIGLLLLSGTALFSAGSALAQDTIDLAQKPVSVKEVKDGLFPDDECQQLKAAGFKCMGFKPAVRFSLPAAAFKVGSAELPDALKLQLDTFSEALKGRKADDRKVRVEGHADASGTPEANIELSQRRAENAKRYLVAKGVSDQLLVAVGVGAREPKLASSPMAPENRRVVIGRDSEAKATPN